jgi:hypothetical protein
VKSKVVSLVSGVCGLMLVCGLAYGAALTAERDTYQRLNQYTSLTVASNSIIYAGALVCVDSNGLAVAAADSAGYAVVGRAEATVDNRGVLYSATKTIKVARGTFHWANGDVIAVADIGKIVYVTDDQTVNKTGGGQNIIAGTVVDVDSSGVWVDTAKVGPIGAATPSSLAVSGAATIGSTLGVTGAATLTGNAIANELDARTATALLLGKATATSVTIGASDADVSVPGALGVTGAATLTGNAIANELDARTATALLLGKATATSVTIGASDADVSVPGALGVTGAATLTGNAIANELDARTATALLLGKATATSVTIGASDADVSVPGALGVTGAITGSSTVSATGYKIGAIAGYSGSITNISTLSTNIMQYAGGVLTNSVNNP